MERRGGFGGYRNDSSSSGGGFAPVKEGEVLDVRIEAVGEKGDGIAKKKGFVLFIPNTKEGDEVKVKVTKVLKKVGFAEVIGEATTLKGAPKDAPRQQKKEEDDLIPVGDNSDSFGDEKSEEKQEKEKEPKADSNEEVPEDDETAELPEDELDEPPAAD